MHVYMKRFDQLEHLVYSAYLAVGFKHRIRREFEQQSLCFANFTWHSYERYYKLLLITTTV
jgi:hypothetical protein